MDVLIEYKDKDGRGGHLILRDIDHNKLVWQIAVTKSKYEDVRVFFLQERWCHCGHNCTTMLGWEKGAELVPLE